VRPLRATLGQPPIVAIQRGNGALRLFSASEQIQRRLRNYCGSVAFDRDGQCFAVTAPRGGTTTCWLFERQQNGRHSLPYESDSVKVCLGRAEPANAQRVFLHCPTQAPRLV
jgi:hypothetical protein